MTLDDLLQPTYSQMLDTLSGWLAKAEQARGADADALMAARLAHDMFPLATQVRFACAQALEGTARLAGKALPPEVTRLLDEGRAAGENPGTLQDARRAIADTLSAIASSAADTADEHRALPHALPMGIVFDFTAAQYARDWTLPQFFFHVMTAYAILRKEGVPLGKADYIAHLFPFIRPGTMPEQMAAHARDSAG